MGERGRVVIPAEIRERHGLKPGTRLVLVEREDGLVLMTADDMLERIRENCRGHDLVGSLLADRRAEAARDVAELES